MIWRFSGCFYWHSGERIGLDGADAPVTRAPASSEGFRLGPNAGKPKRAWQRPICSDRCGNFLPEIDELVIRSSRPLVTELGKS